MKSQRQRKRNNCSLVPSQNAQAPGKCTAHGFSQDPPGTTRPPGEGSEDQSGPESQSLSFPPLAPGSLEMVNSCLLF